jgi:WhiB family redox-sensing transcriptional regulator
MGDRPYLRVDVPKFIREGAASCASKSVDPELFFPIELEDTTGKITSSYRDLQEAKKICSSCPLSLKCLEYAITSYDLGVWGGTTDQQRTNIRRKSTKIKLRIHLKR